MGTNRKYLDIQQVRKMPNKYANKYNAEHYKRLGMDISPEVDAIIRAKMESEGFETAKDFFYALFRDEYHIDLNHVPDEVLPEE